MRKNRTKRKSYRRSEGFIGKIKKIVLGNSLSTPSYQEATNNLYRLIANTEPQKVKYLIDDIYKFPSAKNLIANSEQDYNEMVLPGQIWMNTEVEIALFLKAIAANKSKLQGFIDYTIKYEELYLYGKYGDALEHLDKLIEVYGPTLWAIENKVNLLLMSEGVEVCQKYLSNIKTKVESGLVDLLLSNFFDRGNSKDARLFINKHKRGLFRELRTSGHKGLADFISIMSIPFDYDDSRTLSISLSLAKKLNIFDRYLYIRKIFFSLSNKKLQHEELGVSQEILENFYMRMQELLPSELWSNFQMTVPDNINSELGLKILKEYTLGNYNAAIENFHKFMEEEPLNLSYSEVYVRAHLYLNKPLTENNNWKKQSLIGSFLENLYHICIVDEQISECEDKIEQLIIRNGSLKLVSPIKAVFRSVFPHRNTKYLINSLKELHNSPFNGTPKFRDLLENSGKNSSGFFNEVIELLGISNESLSLISNERKRRYQIIKETSECIVKNDELEQKIELAFKIEEKALYPDYLNLKFNYLYKTKQYDQAANFIANVCVKNIHYYRCFPLSKFINTLSNLENLDLKSPAIPVVFQIYSKMISIDFDDHLADFYEEYIESNLVEKPSDILKQKDYLDDLELYLFKFVCVPSIMDVSTKFKSSDELKSERILIIDLLNSKFNIEAQFLTKEKTEIINEIIVQKSAKGIESSKIYVDVQELKNKRRDDYEGLYKLYLLSSDEDDDYLELETSNNGTGTSQYLYKGGKNGALQRVFANMRQDFVFSNDYGIDRYLSSEIRHGIFVNQLRAGIERYLRVTEKDDQNIYLPNVFWLQHYDYLQPELLKTLEKGFAKFTKDFDQAITKANDWFKVTSDESEKNHLFNYAITVDDFEELKDATNKTNNFEDFFDTLISFMWALTERSLKNSKRKINEELKKSLLDIFDTFRLDIEPVTNSFQLAELSTELNKAQNAVLEDIITTTDWFKRDESNSLTDLSVENCVEVAIESFRAICKPKELKINLASDSELTKLSFVSAKKVKCLVLALITSFSNSLKYGRTLDDFHFKVYIISEGSKFHILVKNDVKEDVLENLLNGKFIEVKEKLSTEDARDMMVIEGGAGLGKIKYLLNEAFDYPQIDIALNHNIFEVEFIVEIKDENNESFSN